MSINFFTPVLRNWVIFCYPFSRHCLDWDTMVLALSISLHIKTIYVEIVFILCCSISQSNMASFTIQSSVVDPSSLLEWKNAWLALWKKEETTSSVIRLRHASEWVVEEEHIPWCPYHYAFCILHRSMKGVQSWYH